MLILDLYSVRCELSIGKNLNDLPLRVTYYSRVSTDSDEQQKSLFNQSEHFKNYILSNSNWTYIDGYVDNGITGTSDIKRNNFMRMIDDAKKNKFDLIITKEISRFSRNTLDSIKYTRLLLSYGVAVLFVNDNINTISSDSELRLTIMASMAQDEIRRLSERVKFGMRRSIERGEILGNDMLYGYRKNKSVGSLFIVEEEAELVRRIFRLYAINHYSLSKISKLFNSEGLVTRESKKWTVVTLSRMISNPKYKGYYCGGKTEIVDYMTKRVKYIGKDSWKMFEDKKKIPPIVSEALWNLANERLCSRKKSFKFKKENKDIFDGNLYSGKIFCKRDKMVFYRRKYRKKVNDISWICSGCLTNGKKFCDSANVRESELNYIFKDLMNYFDCFLSNIFLFLKECYKGTDSVTNKLFDLLKKKQHIYNKKNKLLSLNIDGIISSFEFLNNNECLNKELLCLDDSIKKLFEVDNILLNVNLALLEKIYSKKDLKKIISMVVKKIFVCKEDNNISLDIYLDSYFSGNKMICKYYSFTRGYDTRNTRRYSVYYKVNCYIN